jgi:hypothetical protein
VPAGAAGLQVPSCRACSDAARLSSGTAGSASAQRTDALSCDAGNGCLPPGVGEGNPGAAKLRRRTVCAGSAGVGTSAAAVAPAALSDAELPVACSTSLSLESSRYPRRFLLCVNVRQPLLEPSLMVWQDTAALGASAATKSSRLAAAVLGPGLLASGQGAISSAMLSAGCAGTDAGVSSTRLAMQSARSAAAAVRWVGVPARAAREVAGWWPDWGDACLFGAARRCA